MDLKLPDLYKAVYNMLLQIPEGKITTYGDIARALGDIKASRAVGFILSRNKEPDIYPCYKVIKSDGGIGGYTNPLGINEKIRRLKNDGINVKEGRVQNFEQLIFKDFKAENLLLPLLNFQMDISKKMAECAQNFNYEENLLGAIDVSYDKDDNGYAAFVISEKGKISVQYLFLENNFPYIPGYLFFREGKYIEKLSKNFNGLLLVDGNGILHPRRAGIASLSGYMYKVATVGVAKSRMSLPSGVYSSINEKLKIINDKYILSEGYGVPFKEAYSIIIKEYGMTYPKILKLAHNYAGEFKKRRLSS
ncbi:endonuclease V [Caldiplasma sukawensis]